MAEASSPLEIFRQVYGDREAPARAHKDAGGKVVGYISNNVPVELIQAAGLFPFRITGSPDEDTPLALQQMERFFDGDVLSMFDRILAGRFNFVDLLIIPRSAEVYLQLYYFILEAKRQDPSLDVPDIYLFDILHTPFRTTGIYNRGRVDALKSKLETISERTISDNDLLSAIEVMDANRAALSKLNTLRTGASMRLSGSDMLRATGASMFMATAEHTELTHRFLATADNLPARPSGGPRLLVQGRPLDTARFYELVESTAAAVVAEDHSFGQWWFEDPVGTNGDPLARITRKYHLKSPSLRAFPMSAQNERLLRIAEQANVNGVVFYHDEWDDTLGWDYPTQRDLFSARNIPSVFLKKQSYRSPNEDEQRAAITDLSRRIAEQTPASV